MENKISHDPEPADTTTTNEDNFSEGFSFDKSTPALPQNVKDSILNDRNVGIAFIIHGWIDGKESSYLINGHGMQMIIHIRESTYD